MADLTVTATLVVQGANALLDNRYPFGETVTAGQGVYLYTDNKWYKALNDSAVHAGSRGYGVALNGGAVDQAAVVQTGGFLNPGATVAVGQFYVVSANAGGIAPYADLASTKFLSAYGYGYSTSLVLMGLNATGIQKA